MKIEEYIPAFAHSFTWGTGNVAADLAYKVKFHILMRFNLREVRKNINIENISYT